MILLQPTPRCIVAANNLMQEATEKTSRTAKINAIAMRVAHIVLCSAALLLGTASASHVADVWDDASLTVEQVPYDRALSGGEGSLGAGSYGSGVAAAEPCNVSASLNVTHGAHRTLQYNLTTSGPAASLTHATLCCDRRWHQASESHLHNIVQAYVQNGTVPDHACVEWMRDSVAVATGTVQGTECAQSHGDSGQAAQAEHNGTCPFALSGTNACPPAPWTAGTISRVPIFAKRCVVLTRALSGACSGHAFCAVRAGAAVLAKKKSANAWYAHPEIAAVLVILMCVAVYHKCCRSDHVTEAAPADETREEEQQQTIPCRNSGVVPLGRRQRCH